MGVPPMHFAIMTAHICYFRFKFIRHKNEPSAYAKKKLNYEAPVFNSQFGFRSPEHGRKIGAFVEHLDNHLIPPHTESSY